MIDLEAIRGLCERIESERWDSDGRGGIYSDGGHPSKDRDVATFERHGDISIVLSMRRAVPALLAMVDERDAVIAKLRQDKVRMADEVKRWAHNFWVGAVEMEGDDD